MLGMSRTGVTPRVELRVVDVAQADAAAPAAGAQAEPLVPIVHAIWYGAGAVAGALVLALVGRADGLGIGRLPGY